MDSQQMIELLSDPESNTLAFFGAELRLRRERAGLTQTAMARRAHCSASLLSKIESGDRIASESLTRECDAVLGTDGYFGRLWPVVIKHAFPSWFRPYVQLEEQATVICNFQLALVPGLLQTEDYARAVFATSRLENQEDLIMGRMQRQRVFDSPERPRFWAILEEHVLRRPLGDNALMADQLRKLIEATENPLTVVQILPESVTAHPALDGSFSALVFDEGESVVCVDGFPQGHITAERRHVETAFDTYDLLRALALSPNESVALMDTTLKDLYLT